MPSRLHRSLRGNATPTPNPARRRLLRTLPAVAIATLAWPGRARAAETTAAVLQARLALRGVGLLAVEIDGRQVAITARGLARAGQDLRDDAFFEIGSITKTFTALLLADAAVRKELALGDAVEEALPGVKLRDLAGDPIRWVDLATHRSGLPRLPTNMLPRDPSDPYADYGEARLLQFLADFKPAVARDTRWEYSNLGFGLLGYALARSWKTSYSGLLARRVLDPLGLGQALLATPGQTVAALADGHDADRQRVPHWHFDVMMGAGGLLMNGADLGRYAQAALGTIDSPLREAFLLARREHGAGPVPQNAMGLAWIRARLNGRLVFTHDGRTAGFASSLWLDPDRQRAAAVLGNAAVGVNDLALHLLDASVPVADSTQQTEISLTPEQLAPLVGVYVLDPHFQLVLSVRDGMLWAQATGQDAFRLFAKGPRQFFAKVTELEIEIDAGAPPAALTLKQAGQTLRFVRE